MSATRVRRVARAPASVAKYCANWACVRERSRPNRSTSKLGTLSPAVNSADTPDLEFPELDPDPDPEPEFELELDPLLLSDAVTPAWAMSCGNCCARWIRYRSRAAAMFEA